jgi:hypothetical protein
MTVRALIGLAVLNSLFVGVGASWLWALRGIGSGRYLARHVGVAYFLGIALLGVTFSTTLVLGIPFDRGLFLAASATLVLVAAALRRPVSRWRPSLQPGPTGGVGPVVAAFGLMVIVYLEALFRTARLSPLSAWDAWAFWVPKAMAIYSFEGLDEQFFSEIVNPTYPPLVPALEASAFLFMGSADVVTLHVQFWFFLCGFAAAVAGLLATRVRPVFLWPFLLLVLAAPRVVGRTLDPQADFLLDYFFALAAVLVVLWLLEKEPWLLVGASILLAAALVTKREGLLLVACILGAALVASWREWRFAWPRLGLVAAVAVAASLPWRAWFTSRDLTGELPAAGALAIFENTDRAWPALESAVSTAFDYDLWLVVLPLAVAAVALAFAGGARVLPTYALTLYGLVVAGLVWVLWSFTELELPFVQDEGVNPIVRLTGSIVVASAALLPLLLEAAWSGSDDAVTEDA